MRYLIAVLTIIFMLNLSAPAKADSPNDQTISYNCLVGWCSVSVGTKVGVEAGGSGLAPIVGEVVSIVNPVPSVAELIAGYQRMLDLMVYDSCQAIDVDSPTLQCVQDGQAVNIYNPMYTNPQQTNEPPKLGFETVAAIAQQATAQLQLPKPDVIIEPDPANNEWNALAIGLPIWLRNSNITPVSTSVNQDAIQIDITATPVKHVFDMGNNDQITCTQMAINPGRFDGYIPPKSPNCGYTYLDKTGDYTITSTTTYNVTWNALGYQGNLQATTTATNQLEIIELHTVVVG